MNLLKTPSPKVILALIFIISPLQILLAQNNINFKISKPYCILNFMESATKQIGTSSTLQEYIQKHIEDDQKFKSLCTDFKSIRLDYNYTRDEFPLNRRQIRTTKDLLNIALVSSKTLEEFRTKAIGILPMITLQNLFDILKNAEPYYGKCIWVENQPKINKQMKGLEEFVDEASKIFNTFNYFYKSVWKNEIPFIVALYPIPGSKGNTSATPHGNSLCVGVLANEKDHVGRIGVVLHEICHVLYDEQKAGFQHQLEKYFTNSHSLHKVFAHNFFDEALATAMGNGWAYKHLSGIIDTTAWYENEYIDGFAKELYPLVDVYISGNRQIDSMFIANAIDLFAKRFPLSLTDYGLLLNHVAIYYDGATDVERDDLINLVGEYFSLNNIEYSSPILHPVSITSLKQNTKTQLIIIDKDHLSNQKELKRMFPQLRNVQFGNNSIYCFFDKNNRAIIILNATNRQKVEGLLKRMKSQKGFDKALILQK